MKKKFVDNEVFKFYVRLNTGLYNTYVTVYTPPLPMPKTEMESYEQEYEVQKAYFTPERIEELKKEFIKGIQEAENPFYISCGDRDGGYNVTEDMLFKMDEKSPSV